VSLFKKWNHFLLDILVTIGASGLGGGVVRVSTRSVPITLDWLGVVADIHAELLTQSFQDESGHPQMVTNFNSMGNTNLELPLRGSHLPVGSTDLQPSVQTVAKMSFIHCFSEAISLSNGTIIPALGMRETAHGPTKRPGLGGANLLE
jgi:hypothetical protein